MSWVRVIGHHRVTVWCHSVGLWASVVLCLMLGLWPLQGRAQDASQELRRQEQRQEALQKRALPSPEVRGEREAPAEHGLWVAEPHCFVVRAVELTTTPPRELAWVSDWLRQYLDRCLGSQGLQRVVRETSGELIRRGYVTTRLGVPEQDLSTGRLMLTLVPGVIGAIKLADGGPDSLVASAFPAGPGQVLELRDLEQGLEQLKRVPSQDVDFKIVPGQQAGVPGGAARLCPEPGRPGQLWQGAGAGRPVGGA